MGLFDKINEKIDSFIPGGNKNGDDISDRQKVPGVPAIGRQQPVNNQPKSGEEHQEVIDGNLWVDGINLGPVNTGSMSVQEDVLNILGIPASYDVPDRIMLPGDLAKVKFASEPNGFARDEVAAFYDATSESIDFYIDLLNKRNADVAKLADHCTKLQDEIHDKEMEAEIQKNSGLNIIAGGDSSELMNAKLKIRKLKAENEELRQQSSSTEASDKIKELQKRYDEVQDQLAMEQYNNKQLRQQLADAQSKRDFESEMGNTGFAESMAAFDNVDDDPVPSSSPASKSPRRSLRAPSNNAFNDDDIMSAAGTIDNGDDGPAHPARIQSTPRQSLKRAGGSSSKLKRSSAKLNSSKSLPPMGGAAAKNAPASKLAPLPSDSGDMFDGGLPFDDLTDNMVDDDISFDM